MQSGVHYPVLIPDQPAFGRTGESLVLAPLSKARAFAETEVSLPIHPFLSDEDVERVIGVCNSSP